MNILRLNSVNDVVRYWAFFAAGIAQVSHHLRFALSIDGYRKTLFRLAKQPDTAYIAIALDGNLPVAFVVAHDATPFFATEREFDISIYFHEPSYARAIRTLQADFDSFCSQNNIRRYFVTTCRKSGRPMHVFGAEWDGLTHAHRVFKKEIN